MSNPQRKLNHLVNIGFYTIKPAVPRSMQIAMRRRLAAYKRWKFRNIWPIDPATSSAPEGWKGWPDGKRFALALSHDVESKRGYRRTLDLAKWEQGMGFRSIFNFVPEAYGTISQKIIRKLKDEGFGVGVHGLKHDGKLFLSKKVFDDRAPRINHYLERWGADGFSSPSMHHNLKWLKAFDIEYSISTFDTDLFEPQPDASGTIFPIWVPTENERSGIVELPLTMPQDFTLFVILRETTNTIWKRKLDWIAAKGGMAILNTHPDYMRFNAKDRGDQRYPIALYSELLDYIRQTYKGQYFHAQPKELAAHFREHRLAKPKRIKRS